MPAWNAAFRACAKNPLHRLVLIVVLVLVLDLTRVFEDEDEDENEEDGTFWYFSHGLFTPLHRWLAQWRRTHEHLAERAGLNPTYISGLERGLRNPGIRNVAKLAKALGLTTAELCKGVDA